MSSVTRILQEHEVLPHSAFPVSNDNVLRLMVIDSPASKPSSPKRTK